MNQHTRPFGTEDITFCISSRGNRLVFNSNGNGGRDLFLLDLNSLRVAQITNTPQYETSPAFSPDGRLIVYSAGQPCDRADHLFLRDLDTNQVNQLTSADANDCSPTFSPDGGYIVFTRDEHYNWGGLAASWSGGGSVWSINCDGSGLRRLLPADVFAISPQLSPDGKTLLWWDSQGVWLAPVDGSGSPPRLVRMGGREAVFSPTGNKIAFTQGQYSPDMKIYLIPADGDQPTLVTKTNSGCFNPKFSPDGKTIYYFVASQSHSGTPAYDLWSIGSDGSHAQELAGSELLDAPTQFR